MSLLVHETPLQRIIRKTGRKPVQCKCQCKCKLCKQQCHTPCLGTPQDILKLIEAGYKDRLAPTDWYVGIIMGVTEMSIPMVQAKQEGDWCTFYKDGLCELHDAGRRIIINLKYSSNDEQRQNLRKASQADEPKRVCTCSW